MNKSSFSLAAYGLELKERWDEMVGRSKNGNFLHTRDYIGYHSHQFDERSVLILRNNRPVAVFPCTLHGDRIISHGGLTYGGLIYGTELHAIELLEIFTLLVAYYKKSGAKKILYKAIPHIFHLYPAEEDLYALSRLGARLVRRDISSVIHLQNRIKLSDSRKNTIRKALKNNIEFLEMQQLGDFYELLGDTLKKFDISPVHTLGELELLRSRFPKNIRLFCAMKDGRVLAGTIVFDFEFISHTQYLASSDEGRNIGALDALLGFLLDNIFANYRYFSFGVSTEKDGSYLNEGLIFQKEGFGGRGVVHDFYELEL